MDFWSVTLPLMKKKGIKQKEVAELTGHSSGTVSDWLRLRTMPKADDAIKIADRLGVSVKYLVTGQAENGLSDRENELLRVCRLLNEDKFNIVLQTAKVMRQDTEQELGAGSSDGVSAQ